MSKTVDNVMNNVLRDRRLWHDERALIKALHEVDTHI